jgi:hypothetical protein
MEELSGTHAKVTLYNRSVSFIQSNGRSKFPVENLLNLTKKNVPSVTGKNIREIVNSTGARRVSSMSNSVLYWKAEK